MSIFFIVRTPLLLVLCLARHIAPVMGEVSFNSAGLTTRGLFNASHFLVGQTFLSSGSAARWKHHFESSNEPERGTDRAALLACK
jgi:hypothetical protein